MIRARGLVQTFHTGKGKKAKEVHAVNGVDLDVEEGEVVGFLGPNGAGKTTTLRMLTTLLRPTAGTATVAGYDVVKESVQVRRSIGYCSQVGSTFSGAYAGDEVVDHGMLYGMSRKDAVAMGQDLFDRLQLDGLWRRMPRSMSGGQKRRLDIVMGLIHSPRLVFLDEPTTGLDPQARANLWEHIADLRRKQGNTVFLTTHYLDEADALADRILIIDRGEIVASDTPDNLKAQISGDLVSLEVATDEQVAIARDKLGSHRRDGRRRRAARQRTGGPRREGGARAAPRRRVRRGDPRGDRGRPAHPRRRLPHPHRPLAARRRGRGRTGRPDPRRSRGMTSFLRESLIVFNRQLRMNLRNPAWVIIGMLQPVLYLLLFGPLLEPVISQLGGNKYTWFVPGMLVQLGIFGAFFAGFGLIGEWREGVIEAERVTPASRAALLFGRLYRDLLQLFVQALILVGLGLLLGMEGSFGGIVLGVVLTILLGGACAAASNAFALTVKSEDVMAPVINLVMMPVLLLSGILLPMSFGAAWLERLSDFMPIRHVVDAVRGAFFGDFDAIDDGLGHRLDRRPVRALRVVGRQGLPEGERLRPSNGCGSRPSLALLTPQHRAGLDVVVEREHVVGVVGALDRNQPARTSRTGTPPRRPRPWPRPGS